ncbi:MAG: 23S rRNA (adenine(2503)-C(2))-methyltransferase RlmN [Solirubrobacteraceae bacterium]
MDLELLDRALSEEGEPSFRARQIWEWLARGVEDWEQMSNLPTALRQRLAQRVPLSSLSLRREARSRDGTVKALFETGDGRPVEAVSMLYRDGRHSLCLSSQSGCPLTCTFCATGAMRFGRNLTASEILDQALHFKRARDAQISNVVFMGMGEPMLNVENVLGAAERLRDVGVGPRHVTVSTVGWIPGIERLAEQELPLRLALSLHAADEELRSRLMPVNERYPLRDVIEACIAFYERKRRMVYVEYVMLAGVNDRYEQALALADVLDRGQTRRGGTIFKVNMIPWNPTAAGASYRGSSRESIAAFKAALTGRGIPVTVRLTRGRDIDAACGQLAAKTFAA